MRAAGATEASRTRARTASVRRNLRRRVVGKGTSAGLTPAGSQVFFAPMEEVFRAELAAEPPTRHHGSAVLAEHPEADRTFRQGLLVLRGPASDAVRLFHPANYTPRRLRRQPAPSLPPRRRRPIALLFTHPRPAIFRRRPV